MSKPAVGATVGRLTKVDMLLSKRMSDASDTHVLRQCNGESWSFQYMSLGFSYLRYPTCPKILMTAGMEFIHLSWRGQTQGCRVPGEGTDAAEARRGFTCVSTTSQEHIILSQPPRTVDGGAGGDGRYALLAKHLFKAVSNAYEQEREQERKQEEQAREQAREPQQQEGQPEQGQRQEPAAPQQLRLMLAKASHCGVSTYQEKGGSGH